MRSRARSASRSTSCNCHCAMVKGRYLNGEADLKASLFDGVLIVTLDAIEVNGKKLPRGVHDRAPQAERRQGCRQGPRKCRDAPQAREPRDQGRQDHPQGSSQAGQRRPAPETKRGSTAEIKAAPCSRGTVAGKWPSPRPSPPQNGEHQSAGRTGPTAPKPRSRKPDQNRPDARTRAGACLIQ